jgi:hypothetical protein
MRHFTTHFTNAIEADSACGPSHGQVRGLRREMLVHWSDADSALCTLDHAVYRYTYETDRFEWLFRLPPKVDSWAGRCKDRLARSWLKQRWMPGPGISDLVQLANGDVVVIYDRIYWYSDRFAAPVAAVLACNALPALAPPLRGGIAVHGASQRVYFGEYLNGHDRYIRVFCIDVSANVVRECWRFSRQEIKHIHAIHYDKFRRRLWVCTGDLDHESNLYYTDDEFSTLHKFGGGDQSWRVIAMLFDEHGMEWGMDAGKDAPADAINRIYRHDFRSGQRSERMVIGNPAYAACDFSDGTAVMQTTFEPGRLQDTPEAAALWLRDRQGNWTRVLSLPYGAMNRPGVGRYGMIYLPRGQSPSGRLLFTPVNCQGMSYVLCEWRRLQSDDGGGV